MYLLFLGMTQIIVKCPTVPQKDHLLVQIFNSKHFPLFLGFLGLIIWMIVLVIYKYKQSITFSSQQKINLKVENDKH